MKHLLNQLFLVAKMKSSLGKLYGHHHDLVNRYEIDVLQMTTNMLFAVHDYHRVGSKSNTIGAIYGTGTAYPREVPGFALSLRLVPLVCSFVFCVMSLYVLLLLFIVMYFLLRFMEIKLFLWYLHNFLR
jgi:hypothetical protein